MSIDIFNPTPNVFNSLLHDIYEFWADQNGGKKTWSQLDVVEHLVHGQKKEYTSVWTVSIKELL